MTILHGVPLLQLKKGFWKTWRWWSYAPSIPAARCTKCRLVTFAYDNDEQEKPAKERWALAVIGGVLTAAALAVTGVAVWAWSLPLKIPFLYVVILVVFALLLLLLAAIPFVHLFQSFRFDRSIRRGAL